MNYTKGEWKVEIVDATLPKYHKVYARITPSIGYVGWKDMGVYDDPGVGKRQLKTLNDEALANAHLIAAAPLMHGQLSTGIEALNEALNHLNGAGEIEARDYIKGVITGNEMALAKAEGKERDGN